MSQGGPVVGLRAFIVCALLFVTIQPSLAATVSCPRADFPPVLDGNLDDWAPLPQIVIADASDWHAASPEAAPWRGPGDASAQIRLVWDNQALYLAVETTDDRVVRVRSAAEIDRGDSLVLAMKGDDSALRNQFVVALLRTASLVWRAEPAQSAGEVHTIARALAVRDEDGTRKLVYELAIPWSELRQIRPVPGTTFSFTVSACDDDGDGLKGCIERTTRIRLSVSDIAAPEEADSAAGGPSPVFPVPESERFDERCLILKGQDVLLLGGEVQYWLLPEPAWQERLRLLQAAGLNTVGVTVPWSHHQPLPSPPDLSELRRFLELCRAMGLWVQASIGPAAPGGPPESGVPAWVRALPDVRDRLSAVEAWNQALLPVLAEFQLTRGGPIASVTVTAATSGSESRSPAAYQQLFAAIRAAGITVPVFAPNSMAVRTSKLPVMANIVASLSFYEPIEADVLAAQVSLLDRTEIGPAIITALPGDYRDERQARRSVDRARVALANMAAGVVFSDFAPGRSYAAFTSPGDDAPGVVDAAGALTPGYLELRLLASFLDRFGGALVRSARAEQSVDVDDPDVRAAARYGKDASFLFLWDEKGRRPHQVKLQCLLPERAGRITIPEAGAIYLPPSGAKILLADTSFGRGKIRYCTSEVAALHQLGDRWLLMVYGEEDTAGEIAISLPGPPLVVGDVARQRWDETTNTLVLDYYHTAQDHYLLVDELEIAVLSRERAMSGALATSGGQAVTLVAGGLVTSASLGDSGMQAAVHYRPGLAQATAALPRAPSVVLVDGEAIPFQYRTPQRVATFQISTPSFSDEQRPTSPLDRLGRAILGGPPHLRARFDRALFIPETKAPTQSCARTERIAGPPAAVGLSPGAIARLRTRFSAEGAAELVVGASSYPVLVFLNGQPVESPGPASAERRVDVSALIRPGLNELELVPHIARPLSDTNGVSDWSPGLPELKLITHSGEVSLATWEVCPQLNGEAAGFPGSRVDERPWHYIRLGPWREQGRDLADVPGIGWYRMGFRLPSADNWSIPYYLTLDLRGAGKAYINGRPIAALEGPGVYRLPVLSSLLGKDNVLALALYGTGPNTGLYAAEIAADESRVTRRRTVEIRF